MSLTGGGWRCAARAICASARMARRRTIQLRLANWRDLPPLLVALGVIAEAEAPALTRTMGQLALLSGGTGDLSLPLSFTGGWVALGPLPLGPAPRF
ncbi:MAG: DUF2125 domain-containing protein [Defluviimonas denitrificans]